MPITLLDSGLIQIIHDTILKHSLHGMGLPGNCRETECIQDRINNHIGYASADDVIEIAAIYTIAIAQGHIFNDANKRTAFLTLYIFLKLNHYDLQLSYNDDNTVETMVKIAQKQLSKDEIISWIKENSILIN